MLHNSYQELKLFVQTKLSQNEIEDCLVAIKSFIETIIAYPLMNGILLHVSALDELCLLVGEKVRDNAPLVAKKTSHTTKVLYVATELFVTGGHTAIIEDFIRAQPDKHHTIVITDILHLVNKVAVIERFKELPVELFFLEEFSLQEKLIGLKNFWHQQQPDKVFLFNHHQDVVIIAAAQKDMPGELYFYHHADFQITLGASLKHAKHLDFHPFNYHYCREQLKVDNFYVPLAYEEKELLPLRDDFMKDGKIHTATVGGEHKIFQDYLYQYCKVLPTIMQLTGGNHLHIGSLTTEYLDVIRHALQEHQIAEDNFIYLPHTKNIPQELHAHQIDLYIASFPVGGGRTAIEVMSAGIPIVTHINYRSIFLTEKNLVYPEAFAWRTPDELFHWIRNISPQQLEQHALAARKHYEKFYRPDFLVEKLKSNFLSSLAIPEIDPSLKITADKTQWLLDVTNQFRSEIESRDLGNISLQKHVEDLIQRNGSLIREIEGLIPRAEKLKIYERLFERPLAKLGLKRYAKKLFLWCNRVCQ